jgi:cell division transport system permease protein
LKRIQTAQIRYFTREALHSLITSTGRTFVSVLTIGFALFIFGIYLLVSQNFRLLIERWQEQIHIEVFLSDDLTLKETNKLESQFKARAEILEITYVSKKDAWDKFKQQGYEQFFEGLSQNPLPASFQLKLKPEWRHLEKIRSESEELLKIPGVEDVTSGIDLVEKLQMLSHFIRIAGFFIGLLIFVASLFIISNTIKLSLYTRITEIDILKLVGATNAFIMVPYLIEGVLQGLAGALVALCLLFVGFKGFMTQLRADEFIVLGFGSFSFISPKQWMMLIFIGISIGFLGSFISVGQFLKPHLTRRP